jgi:hypothetical protein
MAGLLALALGSPVLLAGCAERDAERHVPLWLAEQGKIYCYRTLADPDCHASLQPGAGTRLIAIVPQVYFRPL